MTVYVLLTDPVTFLRHHCVWGLLGSVETSLECSVCLAIFHSCTSVLYIATWTAFDGKCTNGCCCIWFSLVLTELFLCSVVYSSRIKALARFVHLFTIQYEHVYTIYALIIILLSSMHWTFVYDNVAADLNYAPIGNFVTLWNVL